VRHILLDAAAAVALILSYALVARLEAWVFGEHPPPVLAFMLAAAHLALAFGFVTALLSAALKAKRLLKELGLGQFLQALWALRIDRAMWSAASVVFRDAASTGALLGVPCGGLALAIILVADATQQTKEQWFFYGLYAVLAGVVGVIVFAPIDRKMMQNLKESGCGFAAIFLLIVVVGLAIWFALGLGQVEHHFGLLRAIATRLLPDPLLP